jgi:porin
MTLFTATAGSDTSTSLKNPPFWDIPAWVNQEFGTIKDAGVKPFITYYGVFQGNPIGGLDQSAAWSQELTFGATLDLEKLLKVPGASIVISGADAAGSNISDDIGNIFTASQAYVTPTMMFYELYWQQSFLDNALQFRLGRITAGDTFATLPAFGLQVNGGINGNPLTVFLNSEFTASPNATWGAYAKYTPTSDTYVSAGIYQATERLGLTAYHGLDFSIRSGDGILLLGEVGWTPTIGQSPVPSGKDAKSVTPSVSSAPSGLPGTYVAGLYYSNLPEDEFLGDGTQQNSYGFYALAQQMIWRNPANPNISFSLWGGATGNPQPEIATMPVMGFAGAIWQGLIPGRDQDQTLFSFLVGGWSSDYADAYATLGFGRPTTESVLEWSYLIQLTPNLTVQPDIQYVLRPGGTGNIGDALILGVQVGASF